MKNISGRLWIFMISVLILSLSGCHGDSREKEASIFACVGKQQITEEAFKRKVEERTGDYSDIEKRRQLLDEMVKFEVLYTSALKKGLDKDPEMIEAIRRLIVNRFIDETLEPLLKDIKITENDITTYYNKHKIDFYSPEMVRAAIIKINIPLNASDEKKEELLEKANKARSKALTLNPNLVSFGSLAVTYSDDRQSRYRGGDTGWIKPQSAHTRWEKTVMDTIKEIDKPGEISPVITGEKGYYIVKLIERKKRAPKALAKVRDIIRYRMISERKKQVEENFYKKLQQGIKISTDYKALTNIKLPDKHAEQAPPAMPDY